MKKFIPIFPLKIHRRERAYRIIQMRPLILQLISYTKFRINWYLLVPMKNEIVSARTALVRRAFRTVLTEWHAESKLNRVQLAEKCNMSRLHLYRLENCRESPTLPTIANILKALGKNWIDFGKAMEKAVLAEQLAQTERLVAEEQSSWKSIR